jgi:hypothetical protein
MKDYFEFNDNPADSALSSQQNHFLRLHEITGDEAVEIDAAEYIWRTANIFKEEGNRPLFIMIANPQLMGFIIHCIFR